MNKINNLDEAIINISKTRDDNTYGVATQNDILYSRWKTRYAETIGEFYADFIKPRLPKPEVVLAWHKVLMNYSQRDRAVFPIRGGYSSDKDKNKEKLRRGWLVRVNDGIFSYTFTDNYFPAYIYKMALDGFCPQPDEFYEYMTGRSSADPSKLYETVEEENITWLKALNEESSRKRKNEKHIKNVFDSTQGRDRCFLKMPISYGRVSKGETLKNVYINTDPAPTCPLGDCGYKHAHILGVRGSYKVNDSNTKQWEEIKEKVSLGEESDYRWQKDINNYAWDRTVESSEVDELRKIIVAHFLRFCDPINHFLSPKQGCNKFTKDNKDYSLDIGEYDNLLSYMMFIREKEFGSDYEQFKKASLASTEIKSTDYSTDVIHVIYHEKKQEAANRKNKEDEEKGPSEKAARKEREKSSKQNTKLKAISSTGNNVTSESISRKSLEELANFKEHAPSGYSKLVMDIMDELSISDIRELKNRIDEAIDFCTSEMNMATNSGDSKRRKYYSNHRSALNKYKQFLKVSDV